MFTAQQLLQELEKLSQKHRESAESVYKRHLRTLINTSPEPVDILTYITQDWGLGEHPFPAQRFIIKVIFGLPLDDRPDDLIQEVIDNRTFRVRHISQFMPQYRLDVGNVADIAIETIDYDRSLIVLKHPIENLENGTWVTRRILTYDRFQENVLGSYNETEFMEFLYNDSPEGTHGRCNLTVEMHNKRLGRQMLNVVLRLGRRSGKTSVSQWIAAYMAYRILKHISPQQYYRVRKDQPIRITLIASAQDQAIDLLRPARAAMNRSSWLKQFVKSDSDQRMSLLTQQALDEHLLNAPGIVLAAAPCSARSVRGSGNILVLLEEYGCFYSELQGSNKSDIAIYAALAPSTAEFTNPHTQAPEGMVLIISTPLTKEAHMFKIESEIREGNLSSSLALHLPSYWVNPLISSEVLRNAYAVDPLVFQQEYEALYLDEISSALPRADVECCREEPGPMSGFVRPDETCYMGVDVGLKEDGTGIAIVAVNFEGVCRLVHMENIRVDLASAVLYLRDDDPFVLDVSKIAHRLDVLWNEYRVQKGFADAVQSYGIQAYLRSNARNNFEFSEVTQAINDRLARNFLATVYQKRLKIYAAEQDWDDPESLLRELVRLQKIISQGSIPKIKLTAPRGRHDDCYTALSRALWLAQENALGRPINTLHVVPGGSSTKKQAEAARARLEVLRRQQGSDRTVPTRSARGRRR